MAQIIAAEVASGEYLDDYEHAEMRCHLCSARFLGLPADVLWRAAEHVDSVHGRLRPVMRTRKESR